MWGGFAGGIALSSSWDPDPRFGRPAGAPPVTAAPMIGDGRLGVVASGSF
jgi:hypothetical protein